MNFLINLFIQFLGNNRVSLDPEQSKWRNTLKGMSMKLSNNNARRMSLAVSSMLKGPSSKRTSYESPEVERGNDLRKETSIEDFVVNYENLLLRNSLSPSIIVNTPDLEEQLVENPLHSSDEGYEESSASPSPFRLSISDSELSN